MILSLHLQSGFFLPTLLSIGHQSSKLLHYLLSFLFVIFLTNFKFCSMISLIIVCSQIHVHFFLSVTPNITLSIDLCALLNWFQVILLICFMPVHHSCQYKFIIYFKFSVYWQRAFHYISIYRKCFPNYHYASFPYPQSSPVLNRCIPGLIVLLPIFILFSF